MDEREFESKKPKPKKRRRGMTALLAYRLGDISNSIDCNGRFNTHMTVTGGQSNQKTEGEKREEKRRGRKKYL